MSFEADLAVYLRGLLTESGEPVSAAVLAARATQWARAGVTAGTYPATVLKASSGYQNTEQVIPSATVNRVLANCDDLVDVGVRSSGGYNSRYSRHWITATAHAAATAAAETAAAAAAVSRERVATVITGTEATVTVDGEVFATIRFGEATAVSGDTTSVYTADSTAKAVAELARIARRAIAR